MTDDESKGKSIDEGSTTKSIEKSDNSKRVIPWNLEDHGVNLKTFTGYDIKLNGWVRKDIIEERKKKSNGDDEENKMGTES
ncbi:hypothetical protein NCAS_0F00480 [Naumovozyma castellii]|uniref:Uncharacterized protein n=1 Tax=Naumovozyma castellii TaxID=27288 RepID=G0VGB2_NAUCA|nr:hypothetical protein NCAS_0F00480 [Naumovozyma castellii CBS 4309]CCC70532.1 hypothetical protein NCAS_0F00480 [Naumovozyma castellii CBS 4309]